MPSFFALVAPLMHAMVIDILPELQAAWSAILQQPEGPVRDRMRAEFDVLPEDLRIPWPDADLAASWRTALEDPQHPRHAAAAGALAELVTRVTNGWAENPDRRYADQLRWMEYFKERYQRVIDLGGGP